MDPNTAYRMMTELLADGEYQEAYHMANDLIGWINRGGFLPADAGTKTEIIRECARVKHESLNEMVAADA
jgi:hypothetical protein